MNKSPVENLSSVPHTNPMSCPCGTGKDYADCCAPFHQGKEWPETAESLMRSRYSAYVKCELGFLKESFAPSQRGEFDENSSRQWATQSKWKSLEILNTTKGSAKDTTGTVEFIARYDIGGKEQAHHEIAEFRKEGDGAKKRWYFVDGKAPEKKPIVREEPKVGRNDPCPCGSGKKYKKCCALA